MKLNHFAILVVTITSFNLWAQDESRLNYDVRFRATERYTEETTGDHFSTFSAFRVDGSYELGKTRCTKVAARVATGTAFNSEWEDAKPGESLGLHPHVRHFYVDTNCIDKNLHLQVGALPVTGIGSLGLTSAGWMDGFRAIWSKDKNREWSIVIGEVDEFDQASAFKRSYGDINMYKIDVTQRFANGLTVVVGATEYNDENYLRWIAEKTVAESRFIQKYQLEQIIVDGEPTAALGRIVFQPIKRWTVQMSVSHQDPDRAQDLKVTKYFYGAGTNVQFEGEYPIGKWGTFTHRLRDGDAGLMGDIGIFKQWKPQKN